VSAGSVAFKSALDELKRTRLLGSFVCLESLEQHHAGELFAVGAHKAVWKYMPRAPLESEADALLFIDRSLERRLFYREFAFAIRRRESNILVGTTRYQNIDLSRRSLEIGWLFVHPNHWGRGAGTEAGILLAQHAFEDLGAARVWFKTDMRNLGMQRTIERCGVVREEVISQHMRARDGTVRASVIYSIHPENWAFVKERAAQVLAV
jgi:RimJ/RimL family protein N-acetyltransferase